MFQTYRSTYLCLLTTMSLPLSALLVAASLAGSLLLYALTGGADYGGGVWDLLAHGPRASAHRKLIAHAIGPIWEANHVWLILAVVVLFTAFPPAFATLTTYLHVPLTLVLIGIVLRGSSFVFRAYDPKPSAMERQWERIFAVASLVTPFLLGVIAGAIMSGRVYPANGFWHSWIGLYPFLVGLFTVALFAYLAAVYLILETEEAPLREDFRKRALLSGLCVLLLQLIVLLQWIVLGDLQHALPVIAGRLLAWPLQLVAILSTAGAAWSLWTRKYFAARAFAVAQVATIVGGWLLAQFPFLIVPDFTIANSAAPIATLHALLTALICGALVLFPSFFYLYRVFKR
jgi:cytochrome d ubiquinol oxidase subunit II